LISKYWCLFSLGTVSQHIPPHVLLSIVEWELLFVFHNCCIVRRGSCCCDVMWCLVWRSYWNRWMATYITPVVTESPLLCPLLRRSRRERLDHDLLATRWLRTLTHWQGHRHGEEMITPPCLSCDHHGKLFFLPCAVIYIYGFCNQYFHCVSCTCMYTSCLPILISWGHVSKEDKVKRTIHLVILISIHSLVFCR
jgi:hypothetical protein